MAKIYQFPDLNVEGYPEFNAEEIGDQKPYTDIEINLQYDQYFQWQYDEYLYNQRLKQEQEQNEQRKRQGCVRNNLVRKFISIFH